MEKARDRQLLSDPHTRDRAIQLYAALVQDASASVTDTRVAHSRDQVESALRTTEQGLASLLDGMWRRRDLVSQVAAGTAKAQTAHGDVTVEIITDSVRAGSVIEEALNGALFEIEDMCLEGHGENVADLCANALERGVRTRMLRLASAVSRSQEVSVLRELSARGAEIRAAPTLPLRFLVVDRALALVSLPRGRFAGDTGHAGDTRHTGEPDGEYLLALRGDVIAQVLIQLFAHCWGSSATLLLNSDAAAGPPDSSPSTCTRIADERYRALLEMLAAGLTDDTVARKLGVSERTVRRRVSELTDLLSADSRFQAGVNAARAGWI